MTRPLLKTFRLWRSFEAFFPTICTKRPNSEWILNRWKLLKSSIIRHRPDCLMLESVLCLVKRGNGEKEEERLGGERPADWESKAGGERKPVVVVVLANFQKQLKNHKAQSWLCLPNTRLPPLLPPRPPQGQRNTIKCPIRPLWWARDTDPEERERGRSEALAAAQRFGGFWGSWRVVRKQLQNTASPDALSSASDEEFRCSSPSVISPDWFGPDVHVNTVIREESSLRLSENCFPFQTEFTFVFGRKMHRKRLRPAIDALQRRQRRRRFVCRYPITMCKFVHAALTQTLGLSQMEKCMKM